MKEVVVSNIVAELKSVAVWLGENPGVGGPRHAIVRVIETKMIPFAEKQAVEEKQDAEIAEFSVEVQAAAERGWNKLRELNPKFDGVEYASFGGLPHPKKLEHLRFAEAASPWRLVGTSPHDSGVIFSRPVEPRVFNHGDAIPEDVATIKTAIGEVLTRKEGGKFSLSPGGTGWGESDTKTGGWEPMDFPAVEVLG